MSDTPRYSGGCQCGAVRYEVSVDLARTTVCNCSRCQKLGWVMAFAPYDHFTLVSGSDNLSEYRFNREIIQHLFCRTCGIESFAIGKPPGGAAEMAAINVRCLDGVDLDTLAPRRVDGRSL